MARHNGEDQCYFGWVCDRVKEDNTRLATEHTIAFLPPSLAIWVVSKYN